MRIENTDALLKWVSKSAIYYIVGLFAVAVICVIIVPNDESQIRYCVGQTMGGWLMSILLYSDLKLYIKRHGEENDHQRE